MFCATPPELMRVGGPAKHDPADFDNATFDVAFDTCEFPMRIAPASMLRELILPLLRWHDCSPIKRQLCGCEMDIDLLFWTRVIFCGVSIICGFAMTVVVCCHPHTSHEKKEDFMIISACLGIGYVITFTVAHYSIKSIEEQHPLARCTPRWCHWNENFHIWETRLSADPNRMLPDNYPDLKDGRCTMILRDNATMDIFAPFIRQCPKVFTVTDLTSNSPPVIALSVTLTPSVQLAEASARWITDKDSKMVVWGTATFSMYFVGIVFGIPSNP